MYALPTPSPGQFPSHPLYGAADFSQWQTAGHAAGYHTPIRNPYSPGGLISHPSLAGRFSPTLLHPMHGSPASQASLIAPPAHGHSLMPGFASSHGVPVSSKDGLQHSMGGGGQGHGDPGHLVRGQHDIRNHPGMKMSQVEPEKPKRPHIKKPLNAFMLFMKEMRAQVVSECTLKESAAINQILGRKWHALSREDQAKYYEMARKEKELHMQLYPGWSARDNYAAQSKRRKKRKSNPDGSDVGKGKWGGGQIEQQKRKGCGIRPCTRFAGQFSFYAVFTH